MSIAAMREEFQSQSENLSSVVRQLKSRVVPFPVIRSPAVFTGSGDSWAAAMFAMELDKNVVTALDPGDLSASLTVAENKQLVIISISGRTRVNIELARKAKQAGIETVALTADATSPLARACDTFVVPLYTKTGILTSGTTSFTTSLLTCAKLLQKMPKSLKLAHSFSDSKKWVSQVRRRRQGKFLFIGSGVDRALAEYGACKIQEV